VICFVEKLWFFMQKIKLLFFCNSRAVDFSSTEFFRFFNRAKNIVTDLLLFFLRVYFFPRFLFLHFFTENLQLFLLLN
jgi:hypothetical protein